jgi:hypothetical protein
MWPDHGSPARSDRRMRRIASGWGTAMIATAADFRFGSSAAPARSPQACSRKRCARRSASANAIGSPLHSSLRLVVAQVGSSRAAGRSWKPVEQGLKAAVRAGRWSSGGRPPAGHSEPTVQSGLSSYCIGSRKSACRSFAGPALTVKRTNRSAARSAATTVAPLPHRRTQGMTAEAAAAQSISRLRLQLPQHLPEK